MEDTTTGKFQKTIYAGTAITASSSSFSDCSGQDELWKSARLNSHEYLMSTNCIYRLRMNGDGNLVLQERDAQSQYSIGKWKTKTQGQGTGPYRLTMQADNNLVLYDSLSNPLWETYTANQGAPEPKAKLHDDGSFVVYDGQGVALWSTNTQGEQSSSFNVQRFDNIVANATM